MGRKNKLLPRRFLSQAGVCCQLALGRGYDFFRNVSYTPYARIPPIMT